MLLGYRTMKIRTSTETTEAVGVSHVCLWTRLYPVNGAVFATRISRIPPGLGHMTSIGGGANCVVRGLMSVCGMKGLLGCRGLIIPIEGRIRVVARSETAVRIPMIGCRW